MGQYFLVANIDKHVYMQEDIGHSKLTEWSFNMNDLVLSLSHHLATDWKGDQVYVIGDYAHSESSSGHSDVLRKIEQQLDCYGDETIYDYVRNYFDQIDKDEINTVYRYIINHNTKEYIDTEHSPLLNRPNSYDMNGETIKLTIAPLPLMLALGNGDGGGDFYGNNKEFVGNWAKDIKQIEITSKIPPKDYSEFQPDFIEAQFIVKGEKNKSNAKRSKNNDRER